MTRDYKHIRYRPRLRLPWTSEMIAVIFAVTIIIVLTVRYWGPVVDSIGFCK